jgi:hypothetical protein
MMQDPQGLNVLLGLLLKLQLGLTAQPQERRENQTPAAATTLHLNWGKCTCFWAPGAPPVCPVRFPLLARAKVERWRTPRF